MNKNDFTGYQGNEGKRVTLRDIAEKAGVSHATVSLALHNNPKIAKKTRQKIQRIADKMGYRPDPMLQSLARYRYAKGRPVDTAIAWINMWQPPESLRSYKEFNLWWEGASEAACRMGYRIDEIVAKGMTARRLASILKTRGIRGVIISPYRNPPPINLAEIPWDDFTVIQFGHRHKHLQLHFVTSSQASNTIMAFERIRALGYKRIGLVTGQEETRMFGAGFYWTQQYIPQKERVPLLTLQGSSEPERQAQLDKWIREEKPDAILSDVLSGPRLLKNLGFRVPEDIGLATTSIHDTAIDAGIDQNPKEIGRMGLITLVSMLQDYEHGIPSIQHEILVGGKWVDGSMLPPRHK